MPDELIAVGGQGNQKVLRQTAPGLVAEETSLVGAVPGTLELILLELRSINLKLGLVISQFDEEPAI